MDKFCRLPLNSAAAVDSDLTAAPTMTPCSHDSDSNTRGTPATTATQWNNTVTMHGTTMLYLTDSEISSCQSHQHTINVWPICSSSWKFCPYQLNQLYQKIAVKMDTIVTDIMIIHLSIAYKTVMSTLWSTTAEHQCMNWYTSWVFPLWMNDRTLSSWACETRVGMSRPARHSLLPFLTKPRRHVHVLKTFSITTVTHIVKYSLHLLSTAVIANRVCN